MKKVIFILIISGIFIFNSCDYKSKGRLQDEAFELQQSLLDEVVISYKDIKEYKFINEEQDARLKIIFKATDSTFKKNKLYKKIEGTEAMAEHFSILKQTTFVLYNLDDDGKLLPDTVLSQLEKIRTSIDTVRKDKYFQALKKEDLKRIEDFIKEFDNILVVKRIKDIDYFTCELMFLYVKYWKSTLSFLRREVARSYIEINRKIDALPKEIFNDKQLREMMKEPFSESAILINLYKEKMKEEFMKGGAKYDNRLKNITLAFEKVVELNEDRFGEDKSRNELLKDVEEIQALLKANE